MIRIELSGEDFRLLVVAETHPAVAAVPLLPHAAAVIELDFHLDRENEVALAVNQNGVPIKSLPFFPFGGFFSYQSTRSERMLSTS